MGFWVLWFWLVLILLFEILFARYASYALGLVLALVLVIAGFLFGWEFDLLAAMLALTYGSVFILLSLLLIQFSSLGGSATRASSQTFNSVWTFLVFTFFWFVFSRGSITDLSGWVLLFLWQDLSSVGGTEFYQAGMVAHELFYRFFIFETIWANVFLALAFVIYALLLKTRASLNLGSVLRGATYTMNTKLWRKKWTSFQARAIHNPRRQTRRLNTSLIRHRF